MLGVAESNYPVLGIPTTTLVIAAFNGVLYGVIAWLIVTFGRRLMRPSQPKI